MPTKPLPKWAMKKYALLWNKFKNKEFEYSAAMKLLKEKNPNFISVLLNTLNKNSWLEIKPGYEDKKKRLYILRRPSEAVENISIITARLR